MAPDSIQPLRINKPNSNTPSPSKMSSSRPLAEISPMGIRRNSPSWNQATKSIGFNGESSPFDASPTNSQQRSFWKSHDSPVPSRLNSENEPYRGSSPSPSPTRRTSLEKLEKASRVKNSNMFARESFNNYDPANVAVVDRPLASGRPLALQFQGNAFGGTGLEPTRSNPSSPSKHRRTESQTGITFQSPPKASSSPSKSQSSPQKSSLSSNSRYAAADAFDPEAGTWSDDEDRGPSTRGNTPRAGLRQAKTVSFDQAPPQVNEYEMITPDPSSVASGSREGSYDLDHFEGDEGFERDSDVDREDSFDESLEDVGKTPVVLPEDWRFMSPELAKKDLPENFDDPFDGNKGTPSPDDEQEGDISHASSTASNSEIRPLPPIPGLQSSGDRNRGQSEDIPATPNFGSRRNSTVQSPPRPASVSKADILKMRESPMPLEERLRLLEIQDQEKRKAEAERNAIAQVKSLQDTEKDHQELKEAEKAAPSNVRAPPRISRESILRNMNLNADDDEEYDESFAASDMGPSNDEIDYSTLDPDVPLPSRESSSHYDDDGTGVQIKREEDINGKLIDMYSSKARDEHDRQSPLRFEDYGRESSVIRHEVNYDDGNDTEEDVEPFHNEISRGAAPDLTAYDPSHAARDLSNLGFFGTKEQKASQLSMNRMSLPEFSTFGNDDFGLSFQSYMSPSPPEQCEKIEEEVDTRVVSDMSAHEEIPKSASPVSPPSVERPATPDQSHHPPPQLWSYEHKEENFGTPESVIHRPFENEAPGRDSPGIPEPVATIKAPGGKLKTRASATPADLESLAAFRRQASGEHPPRVPTMSDLHRPQSSDSAKQSIQESHEEESVDEVDSATNIRKSDAMQLDIPLGEAIEQESGLGIDQEFDRLLEAKKKGYLMRQNTKVIVASNRQASNESKASTSTADTSITDRPASSSRGTKSAGNSPQKQKVQTWTTEPWNGRMRRHSTRKSDIVPGMKLALGPIPPLPGQDSNAVGSIEEEQHSSALDEFEPSGERGRLFVKVVGVKSLDLPLPKNEKSWFQLTLDNGLHCVTTAWLELGKAAPIGQEFELTVFDELEFQLTLQTKLERPQSQASTVSSLGSPTKSPKKASALSRLLTSPKKRREQEKKQQEEEALAAKQRQEELDAQRTNAQLTAWDLLHGLVGPDGSFARAYVSLKDHEKQAFGRPYSVEVPCFNEWAVEDNATTSSTRSKMGGVQRKPPYKIGKLELQLLYVPKPKGVKDEDMPQSMSACVKQLKEAENTVTKQWEGHLSQQGGDCPYWRRRFFKLNGANLTSYHESTRQRRANINLAKAVKLIDDRSSLTKAEGSPTKKGRRKSAFAEEEEGYMFVEEGFRIRFANGEVIDFYAENREDKEGWMKVLVDVVGKDIQADKMTWTRAVLAREKDLLKQAEPSKPTSRIPPPSKSASTAGSSTSKSAPSSPQKTSKAALPGPAIAPPPVEKSPRHLAQPTSPTKPQSAIPAKTPSSPLKSNPVSPSKLASPPKKPVPRLTKENSAGRRQAVRSMIF